MCIRDSSTLAPAASSFFFISSASFLLTPDLISFGASPRASINLVLASKAKAFIDGRGYVIPEDVKYVAKDILRHRILLSYEAEAEEITSEDIVDQLLQEVPVP